MRYCPTCDLEYRDDKTVCSEDGSTLLDKASYDAVVAHAGGAPNSAATLVPVLTLEDRFEAQELADDLLDARFDVALVSNKAPTLGTLTTPGPEVYSLIVPEAQAAKARALLAEWRPELEASQAAAQQAAEEEELASEKLPPA